MPRRRTEAQWQQQLDDLARAAAKRARQRERYGWKSPDSVEVLAEAVAQRVALILSERDRRLALSLDEAAAALGVSRDHFDRHVRGHLHTVAGGGRVLVPVRELERYLERQAL